MSFQRFLNTVFYFLVFLPILSETWVIRAAQTITEQYPLALKIGTTLKANVKFGKKKSEEAQKVESVVWGPQGRLLRDSACASWVLREDKLLPDATLKVSKRPWRYVVALSCKRGGPAPQEIIKRLVEDLLPANERNRLAIILNINEKIVGFDEDARDKKCEKLTDLISQKDIDAIKSYEVPILILYSQWTSYREDGKNTELSGEAVRAAIYKGLDELKRKAEEAFENRLLELHIARDDQKAQAIHDKIFKNYETQLAKLNEEKQDKFHFSLTLEHALDFPFGAMRTFLVSNDKSKDFLAKLHNSDVGLYLHIQDSDFINLKVKPMFYNGFGRQEVVQANQDFLFKRYDALIDHQLTARGCMPVVLGGAYVYDPAEGLNGKAQKSVSTAAKHWSRFAIEMSNLLKLIIGQYAPYGLYFHEPNTLVLLYAPAGKEIAGSVALENPLDKNKVKFGPFCEVQDFTRSLSKKCELAQQRDALVFDSSIIVATSMKSTKRNFSIDYRGGFDAGTNKFTMQSTRKCDCTADSLGHIQGMKQGGLKPQDLRSMIATGFTRFLSNGMDPSSRVTDLIQLLDPYWITKEKKQKFTTDDLARTLRTYDNLIAAQDRRKKVREIVDRLQVSYSKDAKKMGKSVAYSMAAIAWECGQAKRLMLLDYVALPGAWVAPAQVADIRKLLSLRLDHSRYSSGFPTQSYFVGDLLGLNSLAPEIKQKTIWDIVAELYKKHSQRGVASVLGVSQTTIGKLHANKDAPQAIPTVYACLCKALRERKSSDDVCTFVKISYLV